MYLWKNYDNYNDVCSYAMNFYLRHLNFRIILKSPCLELIALKINILKKVF